MINQVDKAKKNLRISKGKGENNNNNYKIKVQK